MHEFTEEVESLAGEILAYSLERLKSDPPLDGPRTEADLFREVGNTITARGLGGSDALKVFTDVLAKACISTDHPRYLAFIPSAPSEFANLFDLVVGASALYGGSWQEGAGAVFAEKASLVVAPNRLCAGGGSQTSHGQSGIGLAFKTDHGRHTANAAIGIYHWVDVPNTATALCKHGIGTHETIGRCALRCIA